MTNKNEDFFLQRMMVLFCLVLSFDEDEGDDGDDELIENFLQNEQGSLSTAKQQRENPSWSKCMEGMSYRRGEEDLSSLELGEVLEGLRIVVSFQKYQVQHYCTTFIASLKMFKYLLSC